MFGQLKGVTRVTTEAVAVELLNFTAGYGAYTREQVARFVRGLLANPAVAVRPCTRELLLDAISLYDQRRDKDYSLTDCMSMHLMRSERITEVLTNDKHFAQEGFTLLLPD